MLKNNEHIEEFKKSLSATVKSIGKNQNIEINFVKENPSVNGDVINLTEPNIENIKNNLNYLRAEADALALEFRLHSKEIHQDFINNDEISNEILNALEQTRIEVIGSSEDGYQSINEKCVKRLTQNYKAMIEDNHNQENAFVRKVKRVWFDHTTCNKFDVYGAFENNITSIKLPIGDATDYQAKSTFAQG